MSKLLQAMDSRFFLISKDLMLWVCEAQTNIFIHISYLLFLFIILVVYYEQTPIVTLDKQCVFEINKTGSETENDTLVGYIPHHTNCWCSCR